MMHRDLMMGSDRIVQVRDATSGEFRQATVFDLGWKKSDMKLSPDEERVLCDRRITLDAEGRFLLLPSATTAG